jgi:hypothetical protein
MPWRNPFNNEYTLKKMQDKNVKQFCWEVGTRGRVNREVKEVSMVDVPYTLV